MSASGAEFVAVLVHFIDRTTNDEVLEVFPGKEPVGFHTSNFTGRTDIM